MTNKFIITLVLCCIAVFNFAQTTDVVYLNNGSIIKGSIIEQTDKILKIETCCGSIFAYKKNEVLKTEVLDTPLPGFIKNKGYFNYTSMGMLVGSEQDDKGSIFSVLMEHHYRLNAHFSFGGVCGIEFFNEPVTPLGGVAKIVLPIKGKSSVYVGLMGGFLLPLEEAEAIDYYEIEETKGGPFANSEIGLIIPSNKSANMFIALGYRYNELNYTRFDWYYGNVDRKITYNRLSLKIGVVLH